MVRHSLTGRSEERGVGMDVSLHRTGMEMEDGEGGMRKSETRGLLISIVVL
jgi:hypothetical protein